MKNTKKTNNTKSGKNRKSKAFVISVSICVVCVALMTGVMIYSGGKAAQTTRGEFVPPPFDASAQSGIPDVQEELGWSEFSQEGMGYTAALCGKPVAADGRLTVYFTNLESNNVWLKLRVQDGNGNTIGESGLIKPGQYIQSVSIGTALPGGTPIKLKIMAYEPETYYSAGAVILNTTAAVR